MKTRVILAAAALLGACAPVDARAAWVGRYVGAWLNEARDCSTGAPLDPVVLDPFGVEVVRSGDRLALNGACLIEFALTDPTHGRFVPGTCDFIDTDGTPVHAEFISGTLLLDRDELTYTLGDRFETPVYCDFGASTFVGLRR